MNSDELLRDTLTQLEEFADPEFAAGVRNFFKEPVDPYGVRSVQLARVEREVYHALKSWPAAQRNRFYTELWKTGKLEAGVLVCHVYRKFKADCGSLEFELFERWLDRFVHNWAHTDGVASWLLAACVQNEPNLIARLPDWTTSKNRWKRRASAVALLQEAKQGRSTQAIFEIASLLLADPDPMVQKGVGWLLKETYPKKPAETVGFVLSNLDRTSRLTVRYAAEKMTAGDRLRVLRPRSPAVI